MHIYRVSEFVAYLKELFEVNEGLQDLWVAGEISNASASRSGHYYFTLNEPSAQIRCVLFRGAAMWQTVVPQNGLEVIVHGRLSIYEAGGELNLVVDLLQPQGQGALALEFELLRARLEAEGLFAPERKRMLPEFPRRIGVVTSPQGAALQDILKVLKRRYPLTEVVLSPTLVQGESAPAQIVEAMQRLNALTGERAVDVIILARGGGAMEELAVFNDERVARSVFASRVPVVTGVGHETDTTIVDMVADLRAPTPSAAAEMVSPNIMDMREGIEDAQRALWQAMSETLEENASDLTRARERLQRHSPLFAIEQQRRRLDNISEVVRVRLGHLLVLEHARINARQAQLNALAPTAILSRGYAIIQNRRDGKIVKSIADIQPGDIVDVRVHDGTFPARTGAPNPAE